MQECNQGGETDKYAWQSKIWPAWVRANFTGVVKAVPSSGKTHAGMMCVEKYFQFFPYDRVWIVSNSKEVNKQWEREASAFGLKDSLEFYTYPGAVSKMHKLDREGKLEQLPQMMILDECHFVLAKVWGQVMDFGVPRYLGLSGTPNGSEKKLGGVIYEVPWESANIADTDVYLVKYPPTESELKQYNRKSNTIETYRANHPNSNYKNDMYLQMLYNGRRGIVYNFKSRIPLALKLVKKNQGKKIMMFCMHKKQAYAVSELLEKEGIPHCIHVTGNEGLDQFTSGEVDVCVSCRKLSTGFNYPAADTAILVSTATSPLTATQTLSRVIRPDPNSPNKKANIYVLLADGTSDTELLKSDIFIKSKIHKVGIDELV